MNNTELNDLIYTRAKAISDKICIQQRNPDRKRKKKAGWEMRINEQIKKLRKSSKVLRKWGISSNKQKRYGEIKPSRKDIKPKILAKESRPI